MATNQTMRLMGLCTLLLIVLVISPVPRFQIGDVRGEELPEEEFDLSKRDKKENKPTSLFWLLFFACGVGAVVLAVR